MTYETDINSRRVATLEAAIDAHLRVLDESLAYGNRVGPVVRSRAVLRAVRAGTTALPQIDPGMIPAGCALPAFDGVEEAQMAAGAGFDTYLQTR